MAHNALSCVKRERRLAVLSNVKRLAIDRGGQQVRVLCQVKVRRSVGMYYYPS